MEHQVKPKDDLSDRFYCGDGLKNKREMIDMVWELLLYIRELPGNNHVMPVILSTSQRP